jgi:limonene-1,2-epoxide hydrolase
MSDDPERIVRNMLAAFGRRDLEAVMAAFAPNAVYHNVPVAPIQGAAGIRQIFTAFLEAMESLDLEVVHLAAQGPMVLTERVDHFLMRTGARFDLPVAGVFEVRDGAIIAFRDYFDLASFERPSGMQLRA